MAVTLLHLVNQIEIEEMYGAEWEYDVHWSELPPFLREDALYLVPNFWRGDPSGPTRPFTADDMVVE